MGAVLGELVVLAVGVAVSPLPVTLVLVLLTPTSVRAGVAFLAGWLAGLASGVVVFLLLSDALEHLLGGGSRIGSWIRLVVGVVALGLAVSQWRSGSREEQGELPSWMSAVSSFSLPRAAGLGFVFATVKPKNLLLCAAAGAAVAAAELAAWSAAIAAGVFVIAASVTVATPVVAYVAVPERAAGPVEAMKAWLGRYNTAVIVTLLTAIGAILVIQGFSGLQ